MLDSLRFEAVEFDLGVRMCDPTEGEERRPPSLFGSCFFSKVKKRKKKEEPKGSTEQKKNWVTHAYPQVKLNRLK